MKQKSEDNIKVSINEADDYQLFVKLFVIGMPTNCIILESYVFIHTYPFINHFYSPKKLVAV